jgi:N-sulfoglucosamine sulfohydrolase
MLSRRALLAAAAAQRPCPRNVLLLLADNWAYPHASAYGDPIIKTPVFDRLAAEGTLFTHAFAPNPSCSPSRSSLLTGRPTHQLGAAASLYGPLDPALKTYPELLEAAGYVTGHSGKGWGPGELKGRPHNPAGRHQLSLEALLDQAGGKPFCFWLGSHDPHVPWDRGDRAAVDPARIEIPAHLPDHPDVRRDIAGYAAEVMQFDRECGAAIETLRQRGLLDDTLVVMTSDNGWQMPRGLAGCYDLGVRIPLAMRLPGLVPAGQNRKDFVALEDLAPTFLAAAGVPRLAAMTGRNLLDTKTPRRAEIYLERERHANVRRGDLSYPVRGVRTPEYLYLWNLEPERWPAGDPEFYWAVGEYGDVDTSLTKQHLLSHKPQPYFQLCFGKRPAEELYDLKQDPGQVRNVAAARPELCRQLRARVQTWMQRTGDPRAKGPTDFWDRAPYSGPRRRQADPR